MDKEKFNGLEITDQIEFINKLMAEGNSLTNACKVIEIERSTVAKRFKKYGFILDQDTMVYKSNTEVHQPKVHKSVPSAPTENTVVHKSIPSKPNAQELISPTLKQDLLELVGMKKELQELLEWKKMQQEKESAIEQLQLDHTQFNGTPISKSFKVYPNVLEELAEFTKSNPQYRMQDIISSAILEYISRYKK